MNPNQQPDRDNITNPASETPRRDVNNFSENEPESGSSNRYASTASGAHAKKTNKKVLWASLIALIAALLIGGGTFAAYQMYQKPEKVLSDVAMKVISAEAMSVNAAVTSDMKYTTSGQTIGFKRLTLNARETSDPKANLNATLAITVNGVDYDVEATGLVADSGDIYVKVVKAVDTVNKFYTKFANGQKLPADAMATFKELENKWVKISLADLEKNSKEGAETYKCTLDVYKAYGKDKAMTDEVYGVYKKHPFVTPKSDAKYKDGLVGYDVSIDTAKSKEFSKALEGTAIGKKLNACDKTGSEKSNADSVNDAAENASKEMNTTTTIWADQWSHELRKVNSVVKYTPKDGDSSTSNIDADFNFGKNIKVDVPSDSMSVDEFMQKLQKGYTQLTKGMSSPSRMNSASGMSSASRTRVNSATFDSGDAMMTY